MGVFRKLTKSISNAIDKVTLSHFKPFTSAVITVGGSGTRMQLQEGQTKQLLEICGMPIVTRTILEFQNSPYIDEIIIVSKADEVDFYTEMIHEYSLTKVKRIVKGGNTRQDSVLNGFKAISEKSDFVCIHDGVRCLITQQNIKDVVKSAFASGCACAGCRVYDTLKIADKNGYIESTADREKAWNAQTPQVFKTNIYRACAYSAKKEGLKVTDDCMLAEHYGFKIKLVDCGRNNLKITIPEDLTVAEAIINSRNKTNGEEK